MERLRLLTVEAGEKTDSLLLNCAQDKLSFFPVKFLSRKRFEHTVEPRNNSPAFKGSLLKKVNILRSQMVVFNVILPLFRGYPEIKVKNLQSQWDR